MTDYTGKTIVAGPWIGEFGWELFAWQGYLRAIKSKYRVKMVVICRSTSNLLYSDFADEIIHYTPPESGLSDSFFKHGANLSKSVLYQIVGPRPEKYSWLPPRRVGNPPSTCWSEAVTIGPFKVCPKYRLLGDTATTEIDVLFHARDRKLREGDNWSQHNWDTLLKMLGPVYTIGSIGTTHSSKHIQGTTDLRDLSLDKISTLIKNCKLVVGPSSGPMHLASLTGAKHLVWSKSENKERYLKTWNPFSTDVIFLDKYDWHPPPEYIYEKVLENVV